MLLAPKVKSPHFRFVEETHTYYLGPKILPSITQILDAMGYVNKDYFKEEHRYRGQYVHWVIRLLNEGTLDEADIALQYRGYYDAYKRFVIDWDVQVMMFEEPLYHPDFLFAGTPDIVGLVLGGIPAIIELKTGTVPKWAALQTAAQAMLIRAWEEQPIMRRRWGVHLKADGTYSKPVEHTEYLMDESVFKTLNSAVQNRERYT
jgi:hypothetical protein